MSEVSSVTTIGDELGPTFPRTADVEDGEIRLDGSEDVKTKLHSHEDEVLSLTDHEHVAEDLESVTSKMFDFQSVTTKVDDCAATIVTATDYDSIMCKGNASQSRLVWDEEEQTSRSRRWRKSLRLSWSRYGDNWWPEVSALFLSFACTWAMVIVLRQYDGQEAPKLPFQLTLNAVISILATTSKVSLMYLVSNSIGQTKWVWFSKRSRNLLDAEIFDDASRGPLGSLRLLSARTCTSLGSL